MFIQLKKNPRTDEFEKISSAIEANDGYCCCAIEHTPDKLCPCSDFRMSSSSGACECGRYYKVKYYPTITICSDIANKDEVDQLVNRMTTDGYIVFTPTLFECPLDAPEEQINKLNDIQKAKIARSDLVYIVNPTGEISKTIQEEIDWARYLKKNILSDTALKD